MYLFRDILIKLESPLLREQKRCVVPSDKSCIINQYKQTFMTIMEDQTSSYCRTGLFNKHPPSFRLFSFSLLCIWISKRMEQILPKRIQFPDLFAPVACYSKGSLCHVICISETKQNNVKKYLVFELPEYLDAITYPVLS